MRTSEQPRAKSDTRAQHAREFQKQRQETAATRRSRETPRAGEFQIEAAFRAAAYGSG
jgi:hypothetical protein